jgi:hypothetical protein
VFVDFLAELLAENERLIYSAEWRLYAPVSESNTATRRYQPRKPMVQRLSAIFIQYIAGSVCPEIENRGQPNGPRSRRCRVGLLAAFAGVRIRRQHLRRAISLTCASPHEMAANRKGCCDNPCSVAIARPEPARPGCRNLNTAILLGWGLAGARCLTGKVGRMHQDPYLSLSQNY